MAWVPPTGAPGARSWIGEKRRLEGAALNGREKSHKIQLCSRQTPDEKRHAAQQRKHATDFNENQFHKLND